MRFLFLIGLLASVPSSVSAQVGTVEAPPGTKVNVSLLWGAVRMIGDDESTVRVARIRTGQPGDPTVIAESGDPVSVVRSGDEVTITQELPDEKTFASSYIEVRFPREAPILIEMLRGGEISLIGTQGDAEVTNHNGSVRLEDVAGSVRVSASNGAITGVITGPLAPSASFASLNGEIDLTLPYDASITARLRTDNGRLRSDFPVEVTERQTSLGEGAEVVAEINGGGTPFIATTRSGDVVLRRAVRR
ncbi:MAG: DUF4097 family beta strand repeat protein [Gemmatimonadetes bacterium]|nr:DUF4097 domain-containing protein [Gemmatimonadota bacterium]NNM04600.1 DUF4097 family beta strand repeat protein [Gemmatimonadota bacterium]